MAKGIGSVRRGRAALQAGCCGLALLAWAQPAAAGFPLVMPDHVAGPSAIVSVQAQGAPAPSSAEELKAAIDAIRAKLAKQREAQPAAPAAGLAEDLRASGQRIAELTAALEQLRAERDGVRQELAVAREQNEQLSFQVLELRRVSREAEAASAEQLRTLEGRLRDIDGERSQAASRVEALTADLAKANTAATAAAQGLSDAEAAKVRLEASLKQEEDARSAAESALRNEKAARLASEQTLHETIAAGASTAETAQAAAAEAKRDLASREASLGEATARVAELERALAEREASRLAAAEDATRARSDQQAARQAAAAADAEAKALADRLSTAEAATKQQTAALDEQRATAARLENEVKLAREEADAAARQRAEAMTADIEASRQRAQRLDTEIQALRAVATTSVNEVQTMGEQLIASLEENRQLTSALAEMRASREAMDRELSAARRDAQNATAEAPALRGELAAAVQKVTTLGAAAPVDGKASPGEPVALVKLQLTEDEVPAAAGDSAQVAALLADLKAVDTGDGWMMAIPEGLEFRPGSDQIDLSSTAGLAKLATLISSYRAPAVRVVGHTDSEGDAEENRSLSQRRAQAVRDFLVRQYGIEARLVTTEGYGESRPIASNDTAAGRRLNRRVEIYVRR